MGEKKQSIWEAYKFSILLIGAILIGSLIGIHFGEAAVKLKPLGDLFINGMFMIVVPLVFITISSSIAGMNDMNIFSKFMKNLILNLCRNRNSGIFLCVCSCKNISTCSRSSFRDASCRSIETFPNWRPNS